MGWRLVVLGRRFPWTGRHMGVDVTGDAEGGCTLGIVDEGGLAGKAKTRGLTLVPTIRVLRLTVIQPNNR